jgi:tripartite-type tricarboxylate transporter receptor subunit TctC
MNYPVLGLGQAVALASAFSLPLACTQARAQPHYPERPVKVVVAFAPGGNNDVPVRIVTAKLAETWGVPVIVDNRAGAGGIVGTDYVAKATPDGYTLLNCNSATHGANPALHKKLPYDAVRNFAAVSLIGSAPNVLIVPANSSMKSAREFLDYARSNPGKVSVGSAGIGSTQHFSLELLKAMTGAHMVHIPYKGGSLALSDVIAGQVPAAITGLPTALAAIKGGKVRALAVTTSTRSKHLPDLPTLSESGVAGYEVTTWTGICAPAGTPPSVVEQLNGDVKRALESADTRQRLLDAGVEPTYLRADQLTVLIANEVARFSKIVANAGISRSNEARGPLREKGRP